MINLAQAKKHLEQGNHALRGDIYEDQPLRAIAHAMLGLLQLAIQDAQEPHIELAIPEGAEVTIPDRTNTGPSEATITAYENLFTKAKPQDNNDPLGHNKPLPSGNNPLHG